jgi:hypothetical protein
MSSLRRKSSMTGVTHLHDPQTLYRHWENEQWNPWSIDLAADRISGSAR